MVRFLLALCVVVTHSPGSTIFGFTMMNGITAVQCFYVISGFLITMILNERPEYQSLGNFYLSRYLRLWPVYILVAGLTLFFFQQPTFFSQLPALVNWPTYVWVLFSNLTILFQDWFVFLKFNNGSLSFTPAFEALTGPQPYWFELIPQAWTLGIELTFYAIAPFVCRRWWGAVGLLLFGLCVRLVVGMYIPTNGAWLYRFAPSEMMMFGAGAVAYFVGTIVCPRLPRTTVALGSIAILCFIYLSFCDDSALNPMFEGLSGGGTSYKLKLVNYPVLLLLACTVPALFYVTRNIRLDRMLGEMSYPIYISHIFVFSLINTYLPASWQKGNALYVLSVIIVSCGMVIFITAPIDRYRRHLSSPAPLVLGTKVPA
ncbi:acyltransferase family protein [Bradyrhizobium sp. AUGA SZCCT0176]|nr:acyltransferase [Bradyrhizobium sp. AUGA SZCCT0176]